MKRFLICLLLIAGLGFAVLSAQKSNSNPVIEKLDPALDAIVPASAKLEMLKADYFGNAEGPVWVPQGPGYLLFADISANHIYKWSADGKLSVFLDRTGYNSADTSKLQTAGYVGVYNGRFYPTSFGSNGMTLDREGRLVWCAQGDRSIVRLEKDGEKRTVLADHYEGKRLNRPNDLVAKSDGWIYFTDPLSRNPGSAQELDFSGVYRVNDSKVELLEKDVQPNGIAFTADEKTLYVGGGKIWKYDVRPDGTITNRSEFNPIGCDGMKLDKQGNIYCATAASHGVRIISPAGKHLGTILTLEDGAGVGPTNLAFGDADGKTLYITIKRSLARIRLNIQGVRANS